MREWVKFQHGMKEPRCGDTVSVSTGTTITFYNKANGTWNRRARRGHDIVVLRTVSGESVLTTTGTSTIKEVKLTDIHIQKDKA